MSLERVWGEVRKRVRNRFRMRLRKRFYRELESGKRCFESSICYLI